MGRLTRIFEKDNQKYVCIDVCGKKCVEGYSECHDCEPFTNVMKKLAEYEDLEEQGRLIKLPCKVGDAVYVITTCKYFGIFLDRTLWGDNGGFGTATGYCCPYELSDSCPHEDGFEECEGGCKCFENKLAVFEDCVECIAVYEHETVVFLINCGSVSFDDFGKTVFLTKEEAEKALAEMGG